MTSNLVVNLNKVRAANKSDRAESSVLVFDYFAPGSAAGETNQRPLVRVIGKSLERTDEGKWMFKGVNLYRVDEQGRVISGAVRTYRLDRINGIIRQP
ncbi:MAG: hypothetical protein V3T23_03080 [Nitrososphaerales archaeon]